MLFRSQALLVHVRSPVSAGLDLVPLRDHVSEADLLHAVQAEVGLLVPSRGAVWVRWDGAVFECQALLCRLGEGSGGGGEAAREGGERRLGGEPGRHGCSCSAALRSVGEDIGCRLGVAAAVLGGHPVDGLANISLGYGTIMSRAPRKYVYT